MAGTVTETIQQLGTVKRVHLDWLSDGDGNATKTLTDLNGQILRVTFKPDSGDTQPTNQYDVTLKDQEEVDVLAGLGVDLANNATTTKVPVVTDGNAGNMAPMAVNGPLDLSVSGAGAANGGEIVLYVR